MESININTTQNVDIKYEVASLGDRILATLLDYLFMAAYVLAIVLISAIFKFGFYTTTGAVVILIIAVLPIMFYDLFFEQFYNGQCPGKMIMKIKVVKLDGTQATFGSYLLRWLLRIVDTRLFSGVVALIAIIFNERGQRIGDMAAGTTVIKLKSKVSLKDTILAQINTSYKVVFPQVAKLTDKDVAIIKDVLKLSVSTGNMTALEKLANKTKETMGVSYNNITHLQFLNTVLQDYTHYNFSE